MWVAMSDVIFPVSAAAWCEHLPGGSQTLARNLANDSMTPQGQRWCYEVITTWPTFLCLLLDNGAANWTQAPPDFLFQILSQLTSFSFGPPFISVIKLYSVKRTIGFNSYQIKQVTRRVSIREIEMVLLCLVLSFSLIFLLFFCPNKPKHKRPLAVTMKHFTSHCGILVVF